jgi:hypothetical protein
VPKLVKRGEIILSPEAAVRRAKAGRRQERGAVEANERNCGPAHLRRARSSIRMRDVLAGMNEEFNSCARQGVGTTIILQTWYKRSQHPPKFTASQRDAMR